MCNLRLDCKLCESIKAAGSINSVSLLFPAHPSPVRFILCVRSGSFCPKPGG